MTRFDLRELCVRLYYTATGKHDVDDAQWNILLDTMNKRYWREAAKSVGSLLTLDTPDLTANIAGGYDYSGSLYVRNDVVQPINFTDSSWSNTNLTVKANAITSPTGNPDGTQLTVVSAAIALLNNTPAYTVYPAGVVEVYFKQAVQTGGATTYLYINAFGGTGGGMTWFNTQTATVGTSGIAGSVATVVPASYPGFPYQVGLTASATPTVSPTGWYKATVILPATATSSSIAIGISNADNTQNATAGQTVFVWGARKSYMGSPAFANSNSNMIDPNGVQMINAVEIKYLGRYIHLDYEIPQDRYQYNIAFGQIQVLIPSAYTLMGEQILLLPKTTGSQVLRITYIPRVVDWVNDNVHALNGFLPDWHHLLAYEAAAIVSSVGDPKAAGPLMMMRNDLRQQWNDFVVSRQRQDGRKIRFVPYE